MRGLGLIIYGDKGIGKTSFGLEFTKPVRVISVNETGFEDLDDAGLTPEGCESVNLSTWPELLKEIRESTDVKTVVIDSLSGISQLMKEDILAKLYTDANNPLQAYGSFSDGARNHEPTWIGRLETICTSLRGKGVNVILIGHTSIEKSKNIIATDYQSAVINMEKWPRAVIEKWAQAILYMTMDFKVRTTKKWKDTPTEAKAVVGLDDAVERIMYTSKHPSHDAKNRLGLPTYISMGSSPQEAYNNFVEVLPPKIKENLNV